MDNKYQILVEKFKKENRPINDPFDYWSIREFCRWLDSQEKSEEKKLNTEKSSIEEIWELLIESLPNDAENLSTLIPTQGLEVVKNFMGKLRILGQKSEGKKKIEELKYIYDETAKFITRSEWIEPNSTEIIKKINELIKAHNENLV